MFDAAQREPDPAAPRALAGLAELVGALDLRVEPDTALRAAWASVHGAALLRIGGMKTFTEGDGDERLRADLSAVLRGICA